MFILSAPAALPFTRVVAERVARAAGAPAPVVEQTASTVAIRYLCGSADADRPDVVSVARRMRRSEFDACARNGVGQVAEMAVGLDLLVIAQSQAAPPLRLSLAQLYLGLAYELPDGQGGTAPNASLKWSQIDRTLPDSAIQVRMLPKFSDTRVALQELLFRKGALAVHRNPRLGPGKRELPPSVLEMRAEEPLVVTHMSEEEIARELLARPAAVGVFSYRFLQANKLKLRGVPLGGAEPTPENAYAGRYPGTLTLYLYVRRESLGTVRGLSQFGAEFVSNDALGSKGYLLALGFLPLAPEDMIKAITQAHTLPALQRDMLPD
jgi:phosphate transport system substrate-binding protein